MLGISMGLNVAALGPRSTAKLALTQLQSMRSRQKVLT